MDDLKNLLKNAPEKPVPAPKTVQKTKPGEDTEPLKRKGFTQYIPYLLVAIVLVIGCQSKLLQWHLDYLDYYLYVATSGILGFLFLITWDLAKQKLSMRSVWNNILIITTTYFAFTLTSYLTLVFAGDNWKSFLIPFVVINVLLVILLKSLRKRHVVILALIVILSLVASYSYYFKHFHEVNFAKDFLTLIYTNDKPVKALADAMDKDLLESTNSKELFYLFKVWFIKAETSESDIILAYPIWASVDGNKTLMELYYGDNNPPIQFQIVVKNGEKKIKQMCFAQNNSLFSADLNNDEKYDEQDVEIARAQVRKKHR